MIGAGSVPVTTPPAPAAWQASIANRARHVATSREQTSPACPRRATTRVTRGARRGSPAASTSRASQRRPSTRTHRIRRMAGQQGLARSLAAASAWTPGGIEPGPAQTSAGCSTMNATCAMETIQDVWTAWGSTRGRSMMTTAMSVGVWRRAASDVMGVLSPTRSCGPSMTLVKCATEPTPPAPSFSLSSTALIASSPPPTSLLYFSGASCGSWQMKGGEDESCGECEAPCLSCQVP
mmetsp:Transcript_50020/g.156551  ORF Transcript_50020/g.156551 Transcript_50020/m.156551 type:complete len:237 (+) Transcript_50020:4540-5250(+)